MKKIFILILYLLFVYNYLFCQYSYKKYPDSIFTTYYLQKLSLFKTIPIVDNPIIFLGNSITEGGQWTELFSDLKILNRGISGDNTIGIINRLDEICERQPTKIFLLIGVNDLAKGLTPDSVVKNILLISKIIHDNSPKTKLYIQSILPVNPNFKKFSTHVIRQKEIQNVNNQLQDSAYSNYYEFLNFSENFKDRMGNLDSLYTNDGLHLLASGYHKWKNLIFNKIYDLPSLIPYPIKIEWKKDSFSLNLCKGIFLKNKLLLNEAKFLQKYLLNYGYNLDIVYSKKFYNGYIELDTTSCSLDDAFTYTLNVTSSIINLKGTNNENVFNGIQTLIQLFSNTSFHACLISDIPAFTWRGFMIDVGRNFQSIHQLKEQIEVMSRYKLNRFHLHVTENIAWRIENKKYPKLTQAQNMLRDKGKYYTYNDLNDLNKFCNERHIKFILEIDMPGHSDSFTRCFGFDMQSIKGKDICKNILNEICDNLNTEYFHIGGDEVRIKDINFLEEMAELLNKRGKKVVAWDPGGKVPPGTILQMWNGKTKSKINYPSIDSRHLYLNHFDPFDGVTSVFTHIINDVPKGDTNNLGATLCNWPDRKIRSEKDAIEMNCVYPVMLTFSERTWHGGGYANYRSDFDIAGSKLYNDFLEFENRLINHKLKYFKNKPFPYFKQSNIKWDLYGPFDNHGNTAKKFLPETDKNNFNLLNESNKIVYGATIQLRHFWEPMISSHLQNQKDSTTWYAKTKIWSSKDSVYHFWIGFNNFSRSTATPSPSFGKWDEKDSEIWVNNVNINAPLWKNINEKVDLELPMIDENYELRPPQSIHLIKGWNEVLLKCPIGSFKPLNYHNPVKWMFTFISVD